jgi:hypothetical protein
VRPLHLVTGRVHRHQAPHAIGAGAQRLAGQCRSRGETGGGEVALGAELVHLPRHAAGGLLELLDIRLGPGQLLAKPGRPALLPLHVGAEHVLRSSIRRCPGPVGAVAERPSHLLDRRQLPPQARADREQGRRRTP